MPDWSYRPFFRPLLFRLPPVTARSLTLNMFGTLGKLPLGPQLINFMGDMQPPATLRRTVAGLDFLSPIGLGAGLEGQVKALAGLERLGFGFIEIGPVTLEPVTSSEKIQRLPEEEAICYSELPVNQGLAQISLQLGHFARLARHHLELGIRLGYRPGATALEATQERLKLVNELASKTNFFTLEYQSESLTGSWSLAEWTDHLRAVMGRIKEISPACPLFVVIPPNMDFEESDRLLAPALVVGLAGVFVSGGITRTLETHGRLVGKPTRKPALDLVKHLRAKWGQEFVIIGSGGILSPKNALDFLKSGADLIVLHSGLIYNGPGLAKRCNEAICYYMTAPNPPLQSVEKAITGLWQKWSSIPAWFYAFLFGIGVIFSGLLAWLVGATLVILPYDEHYLGLMRSDLTLINSQLLHFLSHDRISLAGTMISGGLFFALLALKGIRFGKAWARRAFIITGAFGFAGFFLFLGFGYFDELHALQCLALLPFYILGSLKTGGMNRAANISNTPPNLTNDRRWVVGLWGQFLFVILGFGLLLAGTTISFLGGTIVFVPEDLAFMQTVASALRSSNAGLVPLIAHDRAGFGGALFANGLAVLFLALWGYRQGSRWLWWTFLVAGTIAFTATLSIHILVGYTDLFHLAPVYLGIVIYVIGLSMSYPYLNSHPYKVKEKRIHGIADFKPQGKIS